MVLGGCWSNNVNNEVNLFKTEMSDMPFRVRQLAWAWPHTGIAHPWWGTMLMWEITKSAGWGSTPQFV